LDEPGLLARTLLYILRDGRAQVCDFGGAPGCAVRDSAASRIPKALCGYAGLHQFRKALLVARNFLV
jgi:hypothetical protein